MDKPVFQVTSVAQLGLPVNDLEKAIAFYRDTLGLQLVRRIVSKQRPDTTRETIAEMQPPSGISVFLFERQHPRQKDSLAEDGIAHHAFSVTQEQFDTAMVALKEMGLFRLGPMQHPSGLALYFFDPDGNHLQLEVPA